MRLPPGISALPLCLFLVSSCSPDPARVQGLLDSVAELETANRLLSAQVGVQQNLVKLATADRERLATERSECEVIVRQIMADIETAKADFAAYRADYRRAIQARASGMVLPSLAAGNKTYGPVTVKSLTNTEVTVLTNEGVARVPLADVQPAVQALFAYDPSIGPTVVGNHKGADFLFLDRVIADGKLAATQNKRIMQEMRDAKYKKKAPKLIRAPEAAGPSPWRGTSFEGSYWAPYKSR